MSVWNQNHRRRRSLAHPSSSRSGSASVAQLDRASDFGSEGCRFESCPTRQIINELRLNADWKLANRILLLYTVRMKAGQSQAKIDGHKFDLWQKTSYANLVRYNPSGTYFCRVRIRGKLIRKSLKTDVLSVAKLRLTDEEKKHREAAQRQLAIQRGRGQMTFGDVLEIYRARLEANPDIKSKTKDYYQQRIDALLRTWSGLDKTNVRNISKQDCLDWAARYDGSPTAFNNTVLVLRAVLDIAVESGVIYENAACHITRRAVRPKELHLPDNAQFIEFVHVIEKGGGRYSRHCADLVRFLSYGGFRLGEARNITWGDCDFVREEIVVRGDPEEGTKNSEVRRVPMIDEMRALL